MPLEERPITAPLFIPPSPLCNASRGFDQPPEVVDVELRHALPLVLNVLRQLPQLLQGDVLQRRQPADRPPQAGERQGHVRRRVQERADLHQALLIEGQPQRLRHRGEATCPSLQVRAEPLASVS